MADEKDRFAGLILICIIALNTAIRLYGIGDFSLSNDELSAVFRLKYDSVSDVIRYGVMATDPHPAGVQLFLYYWTSLFGDSQISLRLPFVLAASGGYIFFYYMARSFIGAGNAIICLTLFSFSSFALVQAQLARPYAFGLMTVMASLWAWSRVVSGRGGRVELILYAITTALNFYIHYYAGLLSVIAGLTGLYPALKNGVLRSYILAGLSSIILFLPHLFITLEQLGRGNLTAWIDRPGISFVPEHFNVLLNDSPVLLLFYIAGLSGLVILYRRRTRNNTVFVTYSIILFLGPLLAGITYSQFFGASLIHRVLFFSAPFFFIPACAALPQLNRIPWLILVLLLLSVNLYYSVNTHRYFDRKYVENFKGLATELAKIKSSAGDDILVAGNFNSPKYLDYYGKGLSATLDFSSVQGDTSLARFMQLVRNSDKSEMVILWAGRHMPAAMPEYARIYYPGVISEHEFSNSGMWHFSSQAAERKAVLSNRLSGDTVMHPAVE